MLPFGYFKSMDSGKLNISYQPKTQTMFAYVGGDLIDGDNLKFYTQIRMNMGYYDFHMEHLVVDLKGVRHANSDFLGAISAIKNLCEHKDISFRLKNVGASVYSLLKVFNFDRVIDINT